MDLVYDELRSVAAAYMKHERAGHTLQPTALVNEAYLKLAATPDGHAAGRARLLGVAARAMRQILVDHARGKQADKRGGAWQRVTMSGIASDEPSHSLDTLALDAALNELAQLDGRAARVVELRFFGGLTIAECAEAMGVGHATVESDWAFAKAWLRGQLEGGGRRG